LPAPADPQFNAALQESKDQPDQSQSISLREMLSSTGQKVTDSLTGLLNPRKGLLSDLSNDPVVYWAAKQGWNATTVPLPTPTDSPETVANLTQAQAVVGFGDLLRGMAKGPGGFAKGLYSYGSKMVNQMGAALGFAHSNIVDSESSN
jgi:hypothetical protein